MRLVDDWRARWWRWWSTRIAIAGSFLSGVVAYDPTWLLSLWHMMPWEVKGFLPTQLAAAIAFVLFASTVLARFIKQGEKK